MARFCTGCGKEIPESVVFCTQCGTKVPAEPVSNAAEPVSEPTPKREEAPVVHTPPPPAYQPPPTYSQPPPPTYSPSPPPTYSPPPAAPAADPATRVVGTGAYFGLMLLFALPIVGVIACVIMCFAPKNKNLKHFARANLIWMLVALVIAGLLIGIVYLLSNSLIDLLSGLMEGQSGGWGELGDLEELIQELTNGGQEILPVE